MKKFLRDRRALLAGSLAAAALVLMRDESELAGVLAHEIGHVVKKHGLHAARNAEMQSAGVSALKTVDQVAEFGNASDKLVDAAVNTGFTQQQEFEADEQAVK